MRANNLLEMVSRTVARFPHKAALMWKEKGNYKSIAYQELWDEVRQIAAGLHRIGVGKDDKVAILSENNPKWPICDLAISSLGAVSVPIYPTLPADKVAYILQNADCRGAVVQNREQLQKVQFTEANLQFVIIIDQTEDVSTREGEYSFSELARLGADHPVTSWEKIWIDIDRDQVMTIIHTSGTTGDPKGVMLTHGNFIANIEGVQFWCMEARHDDVCLSYLPLSHVFERMAGQFLPLSVGATIAYAESIDKIPDNLLEVKPTVMTSVPLLFEKVYAKVKEQINAGTPLRRKIFDWAVRVGTERYQYYVNAPMEKVVLYDLPSSLRRRFTLADRLVYQKVKARLGGRLRGLISGGSALNPEIAKFFWAVDIPILEGYGMTETAPVIAANPMVRTKIGTVGKPLPNIEVRIASDGEIMVRGPVVMKGYYKDQNATSEQFTDGWLHTGDLGELDEEGFLRIVDRKKRILVLSTGKNVAPQPLENAINQSIFIHQSAFIGHHQKHVSALIVPDFEIIRSWLHKQGLHADSEHELIRLREVQSVIIKEVEFFTRSFATYEQPKKVVLLSEQWTVEKGELTPTLKVRINEIEKKYKYVINQVYSEASAVEFAVGESEIGILLTNRLHVGKNKEPNA